MRLCRTPKNMKKILLLGSGELGKEFVIAAMRAGQYVIACDRYDNAPAMQVADEREVFSMLDGEALEGEEFLDLVATGDAMLDFALTLDHKEAFLAAQG